MKKKKKSNLQHSPFCWHNVLYVAVSQAEIVALRFLMKPPNLTRYQRHGFMSLLFTDIHSFIVRIVGQAALRSIPYPSLEKLYSTEK